MNIPSSFPLLETERLLLRKLDENDAPQIFELRSDEEHNRFIDRPKATCIEDAIAFIEKINTLIENKQSLFWTIQQKQESTLAGTIGLWNFEDQINKAELGYELLSMHQGKGIMHETISKVLSFAFNDLKLSAIEAWTHPENDRSSSVLKKLGFTRNKEAEKNKPVDSIEDIYILLAKDYSYK